MYWITLYISICNIILTKRMASPAINVRECLKKFTDLFYILVKKENICASVVNREPISKNEIAQIFNAGTTCCFCETKVDKSSKKTDEKNIFVLSYGTALDEDTTRQTAIYITRCGAKKCELSMELLKISFEETLKKILGAKICDYDFGNNHDDQLKLRTGIVNGLYCRRDIHGKYEWILIYAEKTSIVFNENADGTVSARKEPYKGFSF